MLLKKWEDLPSYMKCDEVRTYYDILSKRKISLVLKRFFDVVVASIMLIILAIPMAVIAVMIKFDSHGPVFYRQERVTTRIRGRGCSRGTPRSCTAKERCRFSPWH